jgi:hypothetical protein
VQLEGLGQLKNPITSSGIETATFLFLTFWLNQLRYCAPPYINVVTPVFRDVFKKFTNVIFELLIKWTL